MNNVMDMVKCVRCRLWFRAQQIATRFWRETDRGLCDTCNGIVRNK